MQDFWNCPVLFIDQHNRTRLVKAPSIEFCKKSLQTIKGKTK